MTTLHLLSISIVASVLAPLCIIAIVAALIGRMANDDIHD